jgi:hypothetical protein
MGAKDIYCKQDIQPDCAGASVDENGNISNIRTLLYSIYLIIIWYTVYLCGYCSQAYNFRCRNIEQNLQQTVAAVFQSFHRIIFSIRMRQNFHQDAAKFSSGRGKISIKTQQNFLQDAAKFSSGRSRTFFRTQQNFPEYAKYNSKQSIY